MSFLQSSIHTHIVIVYRYHIPYTYYVLRVWTANRVFKYNYIMYITFICIHTKDYGGRRRDPIMCFGLTGVMNGL